MDPLQGQQLTIKIKTIDNQTFEFQVNLKMLILDLKKQIEKTVNIPINRQRLIFKGRMVNNEDSLAQLKVNYIKIWQIEEANANPTNGGSNQVGNNQEDQTTQLLQSSPTQRGPAVGIVDEHDSLGGILRLNDPQENRRQSRRKVLQQRLSGFPHLPSRPCPALYQNLLTMNQLLNSLSSLLEVQENGQVFTSIKEFEQGMWVDVKDPNGEWQEAQIIQRHANHVFVHYNSLGCRLQEEWLHASTPRLAAFRSHTVQNVSNAYMSPTPTTQPILQGPTGQGLHELIGQTAVLMVRVGNMMGRLVDERNKDSSSQSKKSQSEMQSLINGMIEEQRRIQECNDKMDSKSFQQDNDATSLKSLKSMKSEKISVDYDTSSIKSMKSDISKMTNFYNTNYPHILQENIREEEEDSQEVSSDNENNLATNLSKDSKETSTTNGREWEATLLAAQLAPIIDRLGRLLIDLSPYLAMTGAQIQNLFTNTTINNISNLSILTNEGSQYSQNHIPQSYYFQIPVMLTPQEIQNQPQANVQRAVGDNVDIQIHAYLPQHHNYYHQTPFTPLNQNPQTPGHVSSRITVNKQNEDKPWQRHGLKNRSSLQNPDQVQQFKNLHRATLQTEQPEKKEKKKKLKEVSFSEQIFQLKKQKSQDTDKDTK